MAIEYRERLIGEHMYRVTQLGAKPGRAMLVRLVKLLGPGIGSFVGGIGRVGPPPSKPNELQLEAMEESGLALGFADGIHELCARLNEKDFGELVDQFARHTVVVVSDELQPQLTEIFDQHFAGRYDLMLKWLAFCLEINFGSFFGGAADSRSGLLRMWKVLSTYKSRSTSTGTSTESPPVSDTPTA